MSILNNFFLKKITINNLSCVLKNYFYRRKNKNSKYQFYIPFAEKCYRSVLNTFHKYRNKLYFDFQ